MGHSQSRDARAEAQPEAQILPSTSSLPHSPDNTQLDSTAELNQAGTPGTELGSGSRKRQRSTSAPHPTSDHTDESEKPHATASDEVPRQRRKIENENAPTPEHPGVVPSVQHDGMDLDVPGAPACETSSTRPESSRASTPAYHGEGTPPPHLDPLHEERDRARRRILEALLASDNNLPSSISAPSVEATSASDPPTDAVASTSSRNLGESDANPSPATPAVAVPPEVLATLLQQSARSSAGANPIESASEPASLTQPDSSVRPDAAPQANLPSRRAPLHPSALSGTSMIVQGALVARTIPSRRGPSEGPSNRTGTGSSRPSSTPSSATFPDFVQSQGPSDATDMPNGDEPRAVTLEEQAVMLSRILGIAAAATAASLVNTPGAQHVDRALLQSSLQPPFTPLGQAAPSRGSPELGNWRRSLRSSDRRPRSPSSSSSLSHGLGSGLRERLAAFTHRVRSASESFGRRPTSTSERANTPGVTTTPDNQQEVIARLIDAANREAETRANLSEGAAERPSARAPTEESSRSPLSANLQFGHLRSRSDTSNNTTGENSGQSLLSRFMRETLGHFISSGRPARFDPASNNAAVSGSESQTPAGPARDTRSDGFSREPNDVAGTLQQVRNGVLPDGVAGSFGSFLNHLLRDLMVAVQSIQPASAPLQQSNATSSDYFETASEDETTNGAEMLDAEGAADSRSFQAQAAMLRPETRQTANEDDSSVDAETRARRQRDLHEGNLSFFRLFRFEPVAPSALVPCIVIGVRSLDVTERLGEEMAGARAAADASSAGGARQQTSQPTTLGTDPERVESGANGTRDAGLSTDEFPASRFLLFVSGGRYPANHPLLNSHPTTAGRDLMILMDLLGTMQAMQSKPPTVSQQEIDSSELQTIRGSQVAELVAQGKITENMAERCLVCLEDWQSEEECRLMACRHVFHTQCVDRWMTSSSNTCPMCRRQGVAKDGNRAGGETAESRAAPQI